MLALFVGSSEEDADGPPNPNAAKNNKNIFICVYIYHILHTTYTTYYIRVADLLSHFSEGGKPSLTRDYLFATFGIKISHFMVFQEYVLLHLSKKIEIFDFGLPADTPVYYRVPIFKCNVALTGKGTFLRKSRFSS